LWTVLYKAHVTGLDRLGLISRETGIQRFINAYRSHNIDKDVMSDLIPESYSSGQKASRHASASTWTPYALQYVLKSEKCVIKFE
jgi:hypothetical protein